jgi:hypothetical protein
MEPQAFLEPPDFDGGGTTGNLQCDLKGGFAVRNSAWQMAKHRSATEGGVRPLKRIGPTAGLLKVLGS